MTEPPHVVGVTGCRKHALRFTRLLFALASLNTFVVEVHAEGPGHASPAVTDSSISAARHDRDGLIVHDVVSHYQAGETQIRVLLPEPLDRRQRYPVVYVLPVEPGNETRFGDGLLEVRKLNLHNRHQVIFVAPTFSQVPWYADHPSDRTIRQESYLLNEVIPLIERTYAVQAEPAGRFLLGFSKSGWGAWSLLLRHPSMFHRAAAWDGPMTMPTIGRYDSSSIFGSAQNFEQYRLVDRLRAQAATLGPEKRLILTGYGEFRRDHQQLHRLLNELAIPHEYRDGPRRAHDWHSGWLTEAVDLLLEGSARPVAVFQKPNKPQSLPLLSRGLNSRRRAAPM